MLLSDIGVRGNVVKGSVYVGATAAAAGGGGVGQVTAQRAGILLLFKEPALWKCSGPSCQSSNGNKTRQIVNVNCLTGFFLGENEEWITFFSSCAVYK